MKLIKPSESKTSVVTASHVSLTERAYKAMFPSKPYPKPACEYVGRTTWSRCHVQLDFELPGGDFPIVQTKQNVVFGNHLYRGLCAVRHLGANVYECTVDLVEEVRIGEIE